MKPTIYQARPEQARLLSELAFRSKAYWGYSDEFMQACVDELTYTKMELIENYCYVLEDEDLIVGFYIVKILTDDLAELDALFIEPTAIKKGYGNMLFQHAKLIAVQLGIKKMMIQGDPNAERFYLAMGAVQVGKKASQSIPGRFLPMFEVAC